MSVASQDIFNVRRDYNTWVANEVLEDYALRFTPRSFRKWSIWQVANTAFSSSSFLVLEAIGATLLMSFGFINAALAILVSGLIIFLASLPISRYSARFGLDMDLLTRGSGFGYLGSTVTSLVYAAFTFIFFALEAAIMASALNLAFGIPEVWGYMICALIVIPLVALGITAISRFQSYTQPVWLFLLLLPYVYLLLNRSQDFVLFSHFGGSAGTGIHFDLRLFVAACAVVMPLIAQMGEQADYLRFMPEATEQNRNRWNLGVLVGGSGWLVLSALKMMGGAFLAFLALRYGVPEVLAVNPNQMYLNAFGFVFTQGHWALAMTALFVIVSQLKINVTNAYAGSLAWSNFFSRLTHSHPGRVVWVVFNTLIALMLMELNLLQVMDRVLALFSNVAVPWVMSVVADLVINKRMGFSPQGIEFRRAYLYDINPVGFGAMGITSVLSLSVYLGLFGPGLQPFAILIAVLLPLMLSPLLAWVTQGKYYIARPTALMPQADRVAEQTCLICGVRYEREDLASCPAYRGNICSLCCTLDVRCHDQCKPQASLTEQWTRFIGKFLPQSMVPYLKAGLGQYLLMMLGFTLFLGLVMSFLYYQEILTLKPADDELLGYLRSTYVRIGSALLLISGIIAWWMVLTSKSRHVAQEEARHQTELLLQEINSHHQTDLLLQGAKRFADQANQAKSRYIMAISHELRTPLNSILGYAQILDGDTSIPENRRQAVSVIRRSGDHLLSLIEGTLDIARIEGGKLRLEIKPLNFLEFVEQIVSMFEVQAHNKGIQFFYRPSGELPAFVRADVGRLRQILINILGNAVKFTTQGEVVFHLRYQNEIAVIEIEDTGPGIDPKELEIIFEPFARGTATHVGATGGTGLGLTIAKMLTDLMGGELSVESTLGRGSRFKIRLFLPHIRPLQSASEPRHQKCVGYVGVRRRILVVDNEKNDRDLLVSMLVPLGFQLAEASSGQECLDILPRFCPHLIFMDLAMPDMDGWQTIRRIRASGLSECEIAIISANAFERGAENEVGITAENFITKPVRLYDLVDWIGRHLRLEWVTATEVPDTERVPVPLVPMIYPPHAQLQRLLAHVERGYVRGVATQLGEIEALDPRYEGFVAAMRRLSGQFQFDAMKTLLKAGLGKEEAEHA